MLAVGGLVVGYFEVTMWASRSSRRAARSVKFEEESSGDWGERVRWRWRVRA